MVAVSVNARRWNQACEPVEELEGAEADVCASVMCGAGQPVDQTGVRRTERYPRRLGPKAMQR